MIPWWTLPIAVLVTGIVITLALALCWASAQKDPGKRQW